MGPPSGCATQVTITVDTSQSAVQMDTSIITRTTPSVRKYNTERYIIHRNIHVYYVPSKILLFSIELVLCSLEILLHYLEILLCSIEIVLRSLKILLHYLKNTIVF